MSKYLPLLLPLILVIYFMCVVSAQRRYKPRDYAQPVPSSRRKPNATLVKVTTEEPSNNDEIPRYPNRGLNTNQDTSFDRSRTTAPPRRRTTPKYETENGRRGGGGSIVFPGSEYDPRDRNVNSDRGVPADRDAPGDRNNAGNRNNPGDRDAQGDRDAPGDRRYQKEQKKKNKNKNKNKLKGRHDTRFWPSDQFETQTE